MPDQATRLAILAALKEHGGLNRTHLCRVVGRGWGTVGYHLNILERRGAVAVEHHGRQLWIFDPQTSLAERDRLVAVSHPQRRNLLDFLRRRTSTVNELSDELDVSRKVIRSHLSHLVGAGMVRREIGPPHRYGYGHGDDESE